MLLLSDSVIHNVANPNTVTVMHWLATCIRTLPVLLASTASAFSDRQQTSVFTTKHPTDHCVRC